MGADEEWEGQRGEEKEEEEGGGSISQTAVKPKGFLVLVPDTIIPGHTHTNAR